MMLKLSCNQRSFMSAAQRRSFCIADSWGTLITSVELHSSSEDYKKVIPSQFQYMRLSPFVRFELFTLLLHSGILLSALWRRWKRLAAAAELLSVFANMVTVQTFQKFAL